MAFSHDAFEINRSQLSQPSSISTSEEIIPKEYIECLKKSFGHSRFRTMQWKVISSILNSARDNCVIMATGYGKSLCYQFPSVYRNTITVVVSPLISLMQDQVLGLHLNNIRACFLGSAQTNRETSFEVIAHKYNVVYVTPEYITSEAGTFLIERIRDFLTLIAIDEAHCISKWGHDFRSAYRKLSQMRSQCPAVPILAMTATATTKVRDDIIQSLQLRDPQIVATGFDRANLEFMVKPKNNIWVDIGPHIRQVKLGSIIVYCITRRMTEEVAAVIEQQGYSYGVYHAGRTLKQRQTTHDDFIHDRIRVIIATIAFGMGINKPDVRLVIHYGVSRDVESYYQEVGRAGRDGLPSKCIMFQQPKDWLIHQLIRDRCKLITTRQHMETLILAMNQYVQTTECRRRFILSYFEEDCSQLQPRANCCDNCRRQMVQLGSIQGNNLSNKYLYLDKDGLLDITDETFKMISLVKDIGGKHGLQRIILVLRGSRSKIVPVSCCSHRLYGSLKNKTEKWLRAITNSLLQINMLQMIRVNSSIFGNSFTYPRLKISTKGLEWLHKSENREPIKVVPSEELIRLLKPKELSSPDKLLSIAGKLQISSETQIGKELTSTTLSTNPKSGIYRSLLKVRSQLARLYDIMPYLIASSRALQQLVSNQPTTMEDLTKIQLDGYSEEKIQRFGPVFLKVIKDYQTKNGKPPMNTNRLRNDEFLPIEQMEIVEHKPVLAKQEPKEEDSHPPPKSDEIIDLLSDDDNEIQTSDPHDEDVQIMEPSPPPLIEIESSSEMDSDFYMDNETDIEVEPDILVDDVILNGFDSDIESMYQQVVVKTEKPITDEHSSTSSTSTDLDLLLAAIKSENLIENKEVVKEKTLPTIKESRNKTDYEMDIFDSDWDLEIDDSDLTQVSQKAEEKFYSGLTVKITDETKQSSLQSLDPSSNKLNGVISDLNHNSTTQSQKKLRILDRKTSNAFEYEDDSDSETEHKPIVSPKKRALPSWMQLSNKRGR